MQYPLKVDGTCRIVHALFKKRLRIEIAFPGGGVLSTKDPTGMCR